jgi:hypothetical protein
MKTKKELEKLSNNIGVAIRKYHNAILENLKEVGECVVQGDNEDEDEDTCGLSLMIDGRHNDMVNVVVDKIRFNDSNAIDKIEVHLCREDYRSCDYWLTSSYFGDDIDYVYDAIIWE